MKNSNYLTANQIRAENRRFRRWVIRRRVRLAVRQVAIATIPSSLTAASLFIVLTVVSPDFSQRSLFSRWSGYAALLATWGVFTAVLLPGEEPK